MWRQGDVLIEAIDKLPANLTAEKEPVLAYGEVTGHAHRAIGDRVAYFRDEVGGYFLHAPVGAEVKHEEHATIALAPGNYKVTRQVEYTPEAIRNVAD